LPQKVEAAILVLPVGGIYEVRRRDARKWHNTRTKLKKNTIKQIKYISVGKMRNFNLLNDNSKCQFSLTGVKFSAAKH
jgi:hypothetical protein